MLCQRKQGELHVDYVRQVPGKHAGPAKPRKGIVLAPFPMHFIPHPGPSIPVAAPVRDPLLLLFPDFPSRFSYFSPPSSKTLRIILEALSWTSDSQPPSWTLAPSILPVAAMALQAAYKQFLAVPNSSALAGDASLHYVTTTSSFAGATDIIKHLATLRNKIKKKKEEALFALEARNVLVLEAETVLEFVTSGGPYLPGLDDNFLADRTVYLVVVSRSRELGAASVTVPLTRSLGRPTL